MLRLTLGFTENGVDSYETLNKLRVIVELAESKMAGRNLSCFDIAHKTALAVDDVAKIVQELADNSLLLADCYQVSAEFAILPGKRLNLSIG